MVVGTKRGLRLLKAIHDYTKTHKTWDTVNVFDKLTISSIGDGCISGTFVVTEDMCDAVGKLHSGFTSSLVDIVSSYGIMQHPKGEIQFTTSMDISLCAGANVGDSVNLDLKPIFVESRRAVMECILTNTTCGSTVAKGITRFQSPKSPLVFDNFLYNSQKD